MKKYGITLCLITIFVMLSTHIPPDIYYPAGFLSLTIPVFIFLLCLAFFYFVITKSWWSILPLVILLTLGTPIFGFKKQTESLNSKKTISVLSYNVHGFVDSKGARSISEIQFDINRWIDSLKTDIICLQESTEPADRALPGTYQSHFSGKINPDGTRLGLTILSRFPIVNSGSIEFAFNSYNRCSWVDVDVGEDTLRVINIHLKSYNFKDHPGLNKIRTMRLALEARSYHAGLLAKFIENSPHPVILSGDFNETAYSYVYQKIKIKLQNTFEYSGRFYQHSFTLGPIPLRIDHIFTDEHFQILDYRTHYDRHWSDHFPIEAIIGL